MTLTAGGGTGRNATGREAPAVNETALLAFVITPAAVVLLGYVAVRLQERETARVRRLIAERAHQPAK